MQRPRHKSHARRNSSADSRFKRRVREGIFIITIAIAIFLLLALITYYPTDPGWSHTGFNKDIVNFGGLVGAWLADVLLCAFGYMAYVFPFMLVYAAWIPCRKAAEEEGAHRILFILRTVGFLVILLAGGTLINLNVQTIDLPFGSGGVLGDVLHDFVLQTFNFFGANLILFALLLTGITLFSGLSWLFVIDFLGKTTLFLADSLGKIALSIRFSGSSKNKNSMKREPKFADDSSAAVIKAPRFLKALDNETADSEDGAKDGGKNTPIISVPKQIKSGRRVEAEKQISLFSTGTEFYLPPLSLLDNPTRDHEAGYTNQQLEDLSEEVELRLRDFGIESRVVAVHPGPVVTRFEIDLAAGTKVSRITALVKDLARSLSIISVRVVEVIPGKSVIGLELPNLHREIVRLREILSSQQYDQSKVPLALALGKDISGHPIIVDLSKMPHLLVAGTTGSGKSVCLNAILLSLLYKYTASDVRMILIDPKMLELSVYDTIPHLLVPVVTNMKEAANSLRWCVAEMERRYKLMVALGVRNIAGYNAKIREAKNRGNPILDSLWQGTGGEGDEQPELQELPYIVVIADEYADMIMVVGKKVEELIARIAQKARAAGIHLILATQRPSVDVVTGLIKANIPARIAFQVSSKIDSRTILDQSGAEQLLGHGDMLYLPPGSGIPTRIHGSFVADEEVHKVVKALRQNGKAPEYLHEILEGAGDGSGGDGGAEFGFGGEGGDSEQDALYDQAVRIVTETRKASISSIQRRLKIGYNRAARIVEAMEASGVVSAMETNGSREVLAPPPVED